MIKLAMNKIPAALKARGFKAKMLLQVHDELVFEAPAEEAEEAAALIKSLMENILDYDVPFAVEVGIGVNWSEAH